MPTAPPVLADFVRLFVRHPLRWLVPAAVIATAAAGYALLKSDVWEASLTLVVRAEASGNLDGAGRFRALSDMKTLQETLLEIAKSRTVLSEALVAVGPPADGKATSQWPTPQDVDDLGDALKIVPPKGAEFGATEVFYLKVKANTPTRAVELTDAVADRMLAHFQQVRDEKAQSIVAELEKAVAVARQERNTSVRDLGAYEGRVGGDLAELRNLEQLGSGDGDVRRLTVELENEVRQADQSVRNLRELRDLLQAAQQDPTKLLATPNRLLESQPALRRLKDGLVDAQLRSSQLRGNMSDAHPLVRASAEAENEVRQHMFAELTTALAGVKADLALAESLSHDRERRLTEARQRLDRLASLRAEYSALFAENQQRSRQLEQAEKQLADARAAQAGATAASLVCRVDQADVGSKPQGPGKTTLLGVGAVGGLLVGAGLLLLTVPPISAAPTIPATPVAPSADVASTAAVTPASTSTPLSHDAATMAVSAA